MEADERRDFAEAFREGLNRRGMSLETLRDSLAVRGTPVSLAALSYWRSGKRRPARNGSLAAVASIEDILGMFPGDLESLTTPGRRRLPRTDPFSVYGERQDAMGRLLAMVGMRTPFDELIEREVTTKYDLDERGRAYRLTHLSVMEAVVNDAQRFALVTAGENPDEGTPTHTALGGYEVERVVHDPEAMVSVAEMILDAPLPAGGTTVLEQQVTIDAAEDDNELRYWAWPRLDSVALWIRFHPDKVPARCEAFTIVNGTEQSQEITSYGSTVHRTTTNFGPGTVGIRWHWDE